MNRQLRRIEQTLQKLEKTPNAGTATLSPPAPPEESQPNPKASVSFEVVRRPSGHEQDLEKQISPKNDNQTGVPQGIQTNSAPSSYAAHPPQTSPVKPLVVEPSTDEVAENKFDLPNFAKSSPGNFGFSSHQNGNNPDSALNLLRDALNMVEAWRNELTQVGLQIQKLYLEGPIVDGWLECSTKKVESTTQVLRHAEVNQLMDYVDQLCKDPTKTHPEYRLCGLNAEGKTWSCPCPPDQIASLSLAISRHQKLKPLLLRKVDLEKKLAHTAEEVVKLHSRL